MVEVEKLFWFIFAGSLAWEVAPLVTLILGLMNEAAGTFGLLMEP